MLRNIIFDMGNVLIRYEPAYFVERAGIADLQDRALLLEAVFQSPEWPLVDAGEMTEAQLLDAAVRRLPQRLHAAARQLIFHWNEPLEPICGMAEFVRECKERGLGVYLLSNASLRQPEYWKNVPGSECFDGAVVSACERCVKPDAAIFQRLLDRYGLVAEECLFVDDMPQNVAGAERVGLHGFLFSGDVNALRRHAEKLQEGN